MSLCSVELVLGALRRLGARATLVAGSLLGAERSRSMLFCDDDVDIAVLDWPLLGGGQDASAWEYERVMHALPALLGPSASLERLPWPGCDRIRPARAPAVWIDVFRLRRFESEPQLRALVRRPHGVPLLTPTDAAVAVHSCL